MSGLPGSELPVAVLDASVLVPTWYRFSLRQLAAGVGRKYRPVWSEWIIAETWYVLADRAARGGIGRAVTSPRAKQMLRYFLSVMAHVSVANPPPSIPASPFGDPDDAPIWTAAILGRAHYIVSHNTSDFPAIVEETIVVNGQAYRMRRHLYEGIEILTAIESIEDVLGEDATAVLRRPLPERGVIRSRRSITSLS